MSSLGRRYHIIGGRQLVRFVSRGCVTCRRVAAKPNPQLLGQLPSERITPGPVFEKVGVDYAVSIKYGHVRKPVIVKAYICVFVSLNVKAVHLEFNLFQNSQLKPLSWHCDVSLLTVGSQRSSGVIIVLISSESIVRFKIYSNS